ncbi:MAG: hypothetical protein Q9212_004051 [Teloschistes hypoglaucus]
MRALRLFGTAPSLLHVVSAIPWDELLPTPQGILADAGWTPRPTEAPGLNGVPKELMRRQQDVIYPPPTNWCGFINGDYTTMALAASSVEFLNDYYVTAIGSTLAPSSDPFSFTRASSVSATRATLPSYTSSSAYTSSSSSSDGGGLSADAIRGIAIGVSLGICVIFILLAIFIVRKRRASRMKRASQPNLPPAYTPGPAMQQQGNSAYQPVSQQDHGYAPPTAGYFGPVPGKDGNAVTPQSPNQGFDHQRQSVASTALLSPPSEHGHGSIAGRDSVYKNNGPLSPSITEVDGSDRPLPEADSIQRPSSTHQGMVSPMSTGTHSSSPPPPPPPGNLMQQHPIPGYGQQQAQAQRYEGYVAPHSGAHEVAHTQPYLGPHEMPSQRY